MGLSSKTLCNLANTNASNGTPIQDGHGKIYLPKDLVDKYKVAPNWSTHANQIVES